MIRAVLFDFYGVFLPDSYSAWLEAEGLQREGIYAELINKLDRALITEADFLSELSRSVGHDVQRSDIHRDIPPDQSLIACATELRPNYSVGLLSNASTKLRQKLDDLGMTPLFDHIIISGETGHAKPSDQAFAIAEELLGVPAHEIVFIDDNPNNIAAASRRGLHTVHHTSSAATLATLRKLL